MEKHTHYLGLVCVFVGVATLLFARNRFHRTAAARNTLVSTSPPPSDADVTVFIERQLHEIRSFSARLTPVQRERLKAHVEFYSDEINER